LNFDRVAVDEIVKLREAHVQLQPDVSKPFAHQDKFLKQMTTISAMARSLVHERKDSLRNREREAIKIRLLEREDMIAKDLVTDGFMVTHSMRQISVPCSRGWQQHRNNLSQQQGRRRSEHW